MSTESVGAIAEAAHAIEKIFDPSVGKHAATALTFEIDELNLDGLNLGDVDHGLVLDADSLAKGTESVQETTESLDKAHMARASHQHHKHALRVMGMMLRISIRNKLRIMIPALIVSAIVPVWVFVAAAPAFMCFGFWLGREAREANAEAREKYKKRHEPVAKKAHRAHRLRNLLNEMRKKDQWATAEMMVAVVGSIFHLPLIQQIVIMGVYAFGMTAGVYLFATGLVKAEDWGGRLGNKTLKNPLENPAPQTRLGRFLQRTPLPKLTGWAVSIPSRFGRKVERTAPKVIHAMPVIAAGAKYVTSGRVINHASPHHVEPLTEKLAHLPTALPYIGHYIGSGLAGGVAEFVFTMTLWGATGVAAGYTAEMAYRWGYTPIRRTALKHIPVEQLKKDFRGLATGMALRLNVETGLSRGKAILHRLNHRPAFFAELPKAPNEAAPPPAPPVTRKPEPPATNPAVPDAVGPAESPAITERPHTPQHSSTENPPLGRVLAPRRIPCFP